jgi:uncharacterized damage-inducible protein DinB
MEFNLEQTLAILERTPATLQSLLRGLPDTWIYSNEGPETWSPFDVVGHLIHGERSDWIARAKIILEHGTSRPFEPFDRFAQFLESEGKSLNELLDTFETLRRKNLDSLRAMKLSAADLVLQGTHPALGVVTLAQLLATWAVHDLNHIGQIAQVMARQYDQAVGPWKAYLGILEKQ